ncbi:MAG: hypothetical protein HWE15_16000 [Algoriphagus sp.]|uniref:hypothetical protein n=1 Tax=Algoriphagus sp. TaxID=1872435 RepID=UPI0017ABAAE1|nr:hypothetical protein [Algoriphagus sp.]NVJ87807.1 hypothetical protein [Algoriphagus sp.]
MGRFYYKVYGLVCESQVELPALLPVEKISNIDFKVRVVETIPAFQIPAIFQEEGLSYNESEFYLEMPEIAQYLVQNGKTIYIKALTKDWDSILLFFYSNCLGALLFQKNLIPFHVSGVVNKEGKVWLFAAPSQTGKSTTALKLKEKGFEIFTDDTALIFVKEGKSWAIPSYPMIRAWKSTLDRQKVYKESDGSRIREEFDKYGILYHQDFSDEPREILGVIFLEEKGTEIRVEKLSQMQGLEFLGHNVYRGYWIEGMNKQILQFQVLTSIARNSSFWKASRPENQDTFESFYKAIVDQIME